MTETTHKMIYIAGYERSGSTILDIMLGNLDGHFSVGELTFYPINGIIDNEYCSCGSRVQACLFWRTVTERWNAGRKLSILEYNKVQWDNFRNKRFLNLVWNLWFPGKAFNNFLDDTKLLYQIIGEENGGQVIIDSSKSPYRLLLLKKIGLKPRVIHVVRKISGVLFSTKKVIKKDPTRGVEKELGSRTTRNVIVTWMTNNLLVVLLSFGLNRKVIRFEKFIYNPEEELQKVVSFTDEYRDLLAKGGPFKAPHLVAGGRIRMEKNITLQRELVTKEKWSEPGPITNIVRALDKIRW